VYPGPVRRHAWRRATKDLTLVAWLGKNSTIYKTHHNDLARSFSNIAHRIRAADLCHRSSRDEYGPDDESLSC